MSSWGEFIDSVEEHLEGSDHVEGFRSEWTRVQNPNGRIRSERTWRIPTTGEELPVVPWNQYAEWADDDDDGMLPGLDTEEDESTAPSEEDLEARDVVDEDLPLIREIGRFYVPPIGSEASGRETDEEEMLQSLDNFEA